MLCVLLLFANPPAQCLWQRHEYVRWPPFNGDYERRMISSGTLYPAGKRRSTSARAATPSGEATGNGAAEDSNGDAAAAAAGGGSAPPRDRQERVQVDQQEVDSMMQAVSTRGTWLRCLLAAAVTPSVTIRGIATAG